MRLMLAALVTQWPQEKTVQEFIVAVGFLSLDYLASM